MRLGYCDFNDLGWNGEEHALAASFYGPEELPAAGDLVVLHDGDGNFCEARVTRRVAEEKTSPAYFDCVCDMDTWVHAEQAAALAMAWVRHPTRSLPAWPGVGGVA